MVGKRGSKMALLLATLLWVGCGEDKPEDTACAPLVQWVSDADSDGYGDPTAVVEACEQPSGHVATGGEPDCDDYNAEVHPGADELCNGTDDDCDGTVDDNPIDAAVWYLDTDGDGYGDADNASDPSCDAAPSGTVEDSSDCDDTDPCVHPGAGEPCSGVDSNCDGEVDESCEDCTNGGDDDGDGLVDCEDGDCFCGQGCAETCDDGLDDDGDGLVDCEDEDCWGADCHPLGVRATVQEGTLGLSWERTLGTELNCMRIGDYGTTAYYLVGGPIDAIDMRATMASVRGTVQVLSPDATGWGVDQARTTCSWSFASGSLTDHLVMEHKWYYYPWSSATQGQYSDLPDPDWGDIIDMDLGGVQRRGFTVDDTCRLGSSWFLPQQLLLPREGSGWQVRGQQSTSGDWDLDLGSLWYQGALRTSTASLQTSWDAAHMGCGVEFYVSSQGLAEIDLAAPPPFRKVDEAYLGISGENRLGYYIDPDSDLDGDGRDDLLVSTDDDAYIFLDDLDTETTLEDAGYVIEVGDIRGVDGGHDVTGDGVDDLLIGSWKNGVYVFAGADDGSLTGTMSAGSDAWATLVETRSSGLGGSVQFLGDPSGDGNVEILLRSYPSGDATNDNRAYLINGITAGTQLVDETAVATFMADDEAYLYTCPSHGSDLNGDGVADLVLAMQSYRNGEDSDGVVYLWDASTSGTVQAADAPTTIHGISQSGSYGNATAAGDLDGDGHDDLVVNDYETRTAYVFAGPVTGAQDSSDATATIESSPVTYRLGDLDGDGSSELGVAISQRRGFRVWSEMSWPVGVFTGPISGSLGPDDAALILIPTHDDEWRDTSLYNLTPAGDQNGDGVIDLLVADSSVDGVWLWLMTEL